MDTCMEKDTLPMSMEKFTREALNKTNFMAMEHLRTKREPNTKANTKMALETEKVKKLGQMVLSLTAIMLPTINKVLMIVHVNTPGQMERLTLVALKTTISMVMAFMLNLLAIDMKVILKTTFEVVLDIYNSQMEKVTLVNL
jgi:hypothetical protein